MSDHHDVLIVTVTYDSGEHLEKFLASVPASTHRSYWVVVADNGSSDGAPRRAVAAAERVTLVELGRNLGYGGAVNAALDQVPSTAAWVVVVNPDVELLPGSLDELLDEGRRHPRTGALGPAIVDAAGKPYPSARRFPSLVAGTGHALFAKLWPANPWSQRYLMSREGDDPREVDWLSGACLLLRRDALDGVQGFDERYFMYFEDVDLSLRLDRAGWSRRFVPSSRIVHVGAHSTSGRRAAMVRAHHESAARFVSVMYPGAAAAPLRWTVQIGLGLRSRIVTSPLVLKRGRDAGGPPASD